MVKYQKLLQKEFSKNQLTIDRQARQIAKLEKDSSRDKRIVQNHEEKYGNLQKQLQQRYEEK